ncbi:MAG: hypothetical protein ACPHG7_01885 [Flavobacteriaceae bacterium]
MTTNEVILFTGCSFTVSPYISNVGQPGQKWIVDKTWSTHFSCKEHINVAKIGYSNPEMIKAVFKYMSLNKHNHIDRIIVALSGWERLYTPYHRFTPSSIFWQTSEEVRTKNHQPEQTFGSSHMNKELWWQKEVGVPTYNMISKYIDDTFIWLNNLYMMCKLKNIKLHVFQMLSPWPTNEEKEIQYEMFLQFILKEYTQALEKYEIFYEKNADIYGYPFVPELGGKIIWDNAVEFENEIEKYVLDPKGDAHPNKYGHKCIYDEVIKRLKI